MILEGTVTNMTAFGACIDVAIHHDGLEHISAMSKKYVSDPHEAVRSGDVVEVQVLEVDVARKRISLTLRLDEEANAPKKQSPKKQSPKNSVKQPRQPKQPAKKKPAPRGSMADALKNAGF